MATSERKKVDLREAINAISDVVQNRPRPIRIFDQIYMKTGDMVLQSEFVASWANEKRLAFIGDGDAIAICVAYLKKRGIIDWGPSKITIFDFDERIVSAVKRFADKERLGNLDAVLYNCLDAFPQTSSFDCFYTNPPWGASNDGESVRVFCQRGMEATGYKGQGMIVIADSCPDDFELIWPKKVLISTQKFAIDNGFYVTQMRPQQHQYHLDDAPDLRSCNLLIAALPDDSYDFVSDSIRDPDRLKNFYGRIETNRHVRYIKEKKRLDYGNASEQEYSVDYISEGEEK